MPFRKIPLCSWQRLNNLGPLSEWKSRPGRVHDSDRMSAICNDGQAEESNDLHQLQGLLSADNVPEATFRNDAGHYLGIERRDGKLNVVMWKKTYELEQSAQQNVFKMDLGPRSAYVAFTRDPEGAVRVYFHRNNDASIYTREELWVPDMASYAGDYVADECGAHVTLRWDGSQLMSDDFGERQIFVPGVKGELVGIDPMVLRGPVDGSTSNFASGRPGFKGLLFRRVGPQ